LIQVNAGMAAPRQIHGITEGQAMHGEFQAFSLDSEGARAAYPLVRLHDASITLEKWLRFVRLRRGNPSGPTGLMAIHDCRGIIHALFSYRVDIDLRIRKRLCVGDLIIAHLPGSRIDEAVTASTGTIAARLGCLTISIEQPFHPRASSVPGCPTAELLLRTWPHHSVNIRRH
jgi:hypothetical protein